MKDEIEKITTVEAVCVGAKICECGGMMEGDTTSGLLMSDPPQVKIKCPFCGNTDFVTAPYHIKISFKIKQD